MCDCIKTIKKDLLKIYPNYESIENPNETIDFITGGLIGFTEFTLKRKSETATGKTRTNKKKVPIFWSHCPYCGEKNSNEE